MMLARRGRQLSEETGLEVGLGGCLGTVVGIGAGVVTVALLGRLQMGFTVEGLAWFAALSFAAWWGNALIVVAGMQLASRFSKEVRGRPRSLVTAGPIAVAVSIALPAAIAFVLIVLWPDLVLPAAGVAYLGYFVISFQGEMSDPPAPAAESATTRGDLIGGSLVGLGMGLLLGYISRFGTDCCARAPEIMALGLFAVVVALAYAPLTVAAGLRRHRLDGDSTGIVAMGASILIGFGLAWAALELVGRMSS